MAESRNIDGSAEIGKSQKESKVSRMDISSAEMNQLLEEK